MDGSFSIESCLSIFHLVNTVAHAFFFFLHFDTSCLRVMRRMRTVCRRRNKRRTETKSSMKGVWCPYLYVCANKRRMWARKDRKREEEQRQKVHLQSESMVGKSKEDEGGTKAYRYECMTERKYTRITDASVWSSMREKERQEW